MENFKIEEIVKNAMSGIKIFIRDVNLNDNFIEKYVEGMIIREKGFCDASWKLGGMVTNCRYMILSNHMVDFRNYENGTNWGLFVGQKDSHFKVLNKFEYKGKTQILLLHLPDDESWKMFENIDLRDDEIIDNSNQLFKKYCELPVINELASDEWIKRCSFPLGLDDDGNLFEL